MSNDADLHLGANRLLAPLPRVARLRVAAAGQRVELAAGQVLTDADDPATHGYFPLDAVVSLRIGGLPEPHGLEVALVGPEGMVGVQLLLASRAATLRATVVRPGTALRITAASLRAELLRGAVLRRRLQDYLLVSLRQMAQAVLCTRYHRVDERLARWLLMAQDRAPRQQVPATHAFLAGTLGVRRAGVTQAAASLQARGLIAYRRGVLDVLDRPGLEGAACDCYAADRAAYAALMGTDAR